MATVSLTRCTGGSRPFPCGEDSVEGESGRRGKTGATAMARPDGAQREGLTLTQHIGCTGHGRSLPRCPACSLRDQQWTVSGGVW